MSDGETYIYDDYGHNWVALTKAVLGWVSATTPYLPHKIEIIPLSKLERCNIMPAKGKKPAQTEAITKPEFIGFVNITLSDDELALVDKELATKPLPELGVQLDYLMDIGKLSMSYYRGSVNITCTVLEGLSAGYAVSAFAADLLEAALILRLKLQNYLADLPKLYQAGGTGRIRG